MAIVMYFGFILERIRYQLDFWTTNNGVADGMNQSKVVRLVPATYSHI
jgi:hypothetical protein